MCIEGNERTLWRHSVEEKAGHVLQAVKNIHACPNDCLSQPSELASPGIRLITCTARHRVGLRIRSARFAGVLLIVGFATGVFCDLAPIATLVLARLPPRILLFAVAALRAGFVLLRDVSHGACLASTSGITLPRPAFKTSDACQTLYCSLP